MADVDLLVAVDTIGVSDAISSINALAKASTSGGDALANLGKRTEQGMRTVSAAMSGATKTTSGYEAAITKTGKGVGSLTQALKSLNAEYARLATFKPGASALDRLTAAGGAGGLAAGRATGRTAQSLQAALSADLVRDLIAVEREEIQTQKSRIAVLQAHADVSRATAQINMAGMTAQERAAANLLRAERALVNARSGVAFATLNKSGTIDADNALIAALKKEEQALRGVATAQLEVKSATDAATAAVDRQRQAVAAARAARATALNERASANTNISRAREDLDAQRAGLTTVERATIGVARATRDLAAAEQARKATGFNTTNSGRTAALNAEAAAIQNLAAAEQRLSSLNKRASEDTGNAFQSSFSYFIIAGMATQAAQAIYGVGQAAVLASSEMERAFANVDRTFEGTDRQLASLKGKLLDLSTSTPNSFVDLSEIAALGNQLGVAAEDVQAFTTTIAKYSTISGVSAQDSATAFGKIGNLTNIAASEYSNLASAISYVARTSAATESTIQNTAKEITALASGSGFSAASIVGLAGALSSLAIPPERARGALSLYFGALNSAVAEGGPKLAAFATLTGKTAGELDKLVRENRGEEVFTSFIAGLSELNTVAKTTALDELGLSTIRVDQTMRALSQNVPLLTSALGDANNAFEKNNELNSQYAVIQATFASKLKEFQNSVTNAAGALGDALAPAVAAVLVNVTELLIGFQKFAATPMGRGLLVIAGAVAAVALAMTALIGALALAKASLVIIPWALTGLGANAANGAVVNFIRGLIGMTAAIAPAAVGTAGLATGLTATAASSAAATAGTTAFRVGLAPTAAAAATTAVGTVGLAAGLTATSVASRAATVGLNTMKIALASTGIGLAVVLIGSLVAGMQAADEKVKLTVDGLSGLGEAIKADTEIYNETGEAVDTFAARTSGATDKQKEAADQSRAWAKVLGTDLVNGAAAASKAVGEIAAGENVVELFRQAIGSNDVVKEIIGDSEFASTWSGLGLNMTELIEDGIKGGNVKSKIAAALDEAGIRAVANPRGGKNTQKTYRNEDGEDVSETVGNLYKVGDAINSEREILTTTANSADVLGAATERLTAEQTELDEALQLSAASLAKYQGAMQSGLSDFVKFDSVLESVKEAANAAAQAAENPALSESLVNANTFGTELNAANDRATTFFQGIQTLAQSGSSEFATQLAELGPDAQNILSTALELGPEGQGKLEESARFAAFLASDAFAKALEADMAGTNDIYAGILANGGDLTAVQGFIAAQVQGLEDEWIAANPELAVAIGITPAPPGEVEAAASLLAGKFKVDAAVRPVLVSDNGATGTEAVTSVTNMLTGQKIILPAGLDTPALTGALSIWDANQDASPAKIAALLNTPGLSAGLDAWRSRNGNVTIKATFVATNSIGSLTGNRMRVQIGVPLGVAKGGQIPAYATGGKIKDGLPAFATGGSWGQFRGPGTGTSDSILARVSAGEYINTAKSTSFWGPDFFDSLNRNMLPTSFLNMLGAAAGGGGGPQNITNVSVNQINPLTRDPLKQLREDSEMVASGIWG